MTHQCRFEGNVYRLQGRLYGVRFCECGARQLVNCARLLAAEVLR